MSLASRSLPEVDQTSPQALADIELLRELVSIESLSNHEGPAVSFLRSAMASRGFRVKDSAAGSAIGTIGEGERHIVLLGHIDTVPGQIPVRIENDVLWGRGAVDAKGPLATFAAAASAAAEQLQCRVTVVGATGEEVIGSPGANEISCWPAPDFCIIGEPSGWDSVCLGYRGTMSLIYRLEQSTRHTAGPGESAAEHAVRFWNSVLAELDEWNAGATSSFGSIGHSLRSFNTEGDGLTDVATLSIGLRLPPGIDIERLLDRIRALAGTVDIRIDGIQAGYRTTKRSALIPPFLRGIRGIGGTPGFKVKLGTSDMNVVGPVWTCPIVAYGPGDSALDHTPDERIDLSEYLLAIGVLRDVLIALGRPRKEGAA
ncbi:MAG TPA: [LysW]-lysine hydrolase [Thermomicrobiales bacterium]|nr:[LysW]-lysine hydrolase [Thermomicrobiales bacterium]